MDADAIVVRADLMSAPVDDDIVILVPQSDNYIALDAVGRVLWEKLASPHRVADLIADMQRDFAGPAEAIERDIRAFLAELQREGMVTVVDPQP